MKAQVQADALAAAAKNAAAITQGEITGCLLIQAAGEALTLTGGDGDTFIELTIPATVIRDGVVATPAKVFAKAAPRLNGEVLLTEDDDGRLLVESMVSTLTLPTIEAQTYPRVRWPESDPVDISDCWERLRDISYAASMKALPVFAAVKLLPDGWAEAYDKTRMARTPIPEGLTAAVRRDSLDFAARVIEGEVSISTGGNGVAFYGDGIRLFAATVAGEVTSAVPPQLAGWIETGSSFSCNRKDFLEAIGLIEVVKGDAFQPFRLDISDGEATIKASSADVGSVSSGFAVEGEIPWVIGMTAHFVKDVLTRSSAESITFQFGEKPIHPIVVESDGITHMFGPNRTVAE